MSNVKESKWQEVTEVDPNDYYYEPLHFVRSHSRPTDPDNKTTQIWDVVFQPGSGDMVATCGGRFLCVFKVQTGELMLKYTHTERDHELFTLSWTELGEHKLLASGSASGEVRLFHPAREVSFHHWSVGKGVAVYAVEFHPARPSWLFVGSNKSEVGLWDIGDPAPPQYVGCKPCQLMKVVANKGDIYSMAWVKEEEWLMVGTAEGLVGWNVVEKEVQVDKFPRYKPAMLKFRLPGDGEPPYVDSVCSLGRGLVAVKCVGYGSIYVFSVHMQEREGKYKSCVVQVLVEFKWSKTDDFYMNIGSCPELALIACGDENGTTWLYKLPEWVHSSDKEEEQEQQHRKMLPLGRLPWPDINGNPCKEETMLDKVTFSPCGKYLVSVTNTNIVAIWKRVKF